MKGPYPFHMNFADGTQVNFPTEADHVKAILRCGDRHQTVTLVWPGGMHVGCWKCLTTEVLP